MLNTLAELKDEILVRLNEATSAATGALYTEAILNDFIDDAHKWAAGYHKWPFTEGRADTTFVANTEIWDYPENWKADSIRILQVGGKRFRKTNFEDYQNFREDFSTVGDRIFADFGRTYYINPESDPSGTIRVYGQFTPTKIDYTDDTATTVFSNNEMEGNEAIVEKALASAHKREKKLNDSTFHEQRAIEILEGIWQRIKDEQFGYHTKERSIFKRVNVLQGALQDELLKRDSFG